MTGSSESGVKKTFVKKLLQCLLHSLTDHLSRNNLKMAAVNFDPLS